MPNPDDKEKSTVKSTKMSDVFAEIEETRKAEQEKTAAAKSMKIGEIWDQIEAKRKAEQEKTAAAKPMKIGEIWDQIEAKRKAEQEKTASAKPMKMSDILDRLEAEKKAKSTKISDVWDRIEAEKARKAEEEKGMSFREMYREIRDVVDDDYAESGKIARLAANIETLCQITRSYGYDVYLGAKNRIKNSTFGQAVIKKASWIKDKASKGLDHMHSFCKGVGNMFESAYDKLDKGVSYVYGYGQEAARAVKKTHAYKKTAKILGKGMDGAKFLASKGFEKTVNFIKKSKDEIKRAGIKFAKSFRKTFGIHEPTPEELKTRQEEKARKKKEKEEKKAEKKRKKEEEKQKKKHDVEEPTKNFHNLKDELREVGLMEESTKMKLKKTAASVEKGVGKANDVYDELQKRVKSSQNKIRKSKINEIMRRYRDPKYAVRKKQALQDISENKKISNKLKYRLDVKSLKERWEKLQEAGKNKKGENKQEKSQFTKLAGNLKTAMDKVKGLKDEVTIANAINDTAGGIYNSKKLQALAKDYDAFKTNITSLIANKPKKKEEPKKVTVKKSTAIKVKDGISGLNDGIDVVQDAIKLVNGTATEDDVKHLRKGLLSVTNTACSYGGMDIGYATSFSNALDGLVKLGLDGSKQAKTEVLKAVKELADGVNKFEKEYRQAKTGYVVKEGFIEPHVEILKALTNVTESMNSFMTSSEAKKGADRYLQKEHAAEDLDAQEAMRGAEDIIDRMNLERMEQVGSMVKNIAATAAKVALGGTAKYAIKAADPILGRLGQFLSDEMKDSINESFSRKDITEGKTEELDKIQKKNSLRDEDIDNILTQETDSVDIQHLADKARFDIALKMVANKDNKESEFYKLTEDIFRREVKDDEIMQLFGFKDMKDAKKQVIDRAEKEKNRSMKEERKQAAEKRAAKERKQEEEQEKRREKLYKQDSDMRLFADFDDEVMETNVPAAKKKTGKTL